MKTKLLFILFFAPAMLFGQEISVDSLLQKAESIRQACARQSNKEKIKGYEQALLLQDSIYNLMADSVRYFSAFEKEAEAFRFFSCSDTSIFTNGYVTLDTQKLPEYMKEHYLAITVIRQYSQCIEEIENRIMSAESDKDVAETDKKNYVAIKIKSGIDQANELLNRIDKVNTSTFSDEQNKFYQTLSERLTDILNKYIF